MRKFNEKNAKFREKSFDNLAKKMENIRKKKISQKIPGFLIGWVVVMGERMWTDDRNFKR